MGFDLSKYERIEWIEFHRVSFVDELIKLWDRWWSK
jgi:hypothetical protein